MTRSTNLSVAEAAEATAISALSFLARDPDRIGGFLADTGLGPESLRGAAGEPGFQVAILDHLLRHEPILLAFCEEQQLTPEAIWAARRALGGSPTERG